MADSNAFTPRDFFQLAREAAEHEVEMKIKLAQAGLGEKTAPRSSEEGRSRLIVTNPR